jgi:hypothetical protein
MKSQIPLKFHPFEQDLQVSLQPKGTFCRDVSGSSLQLRFRALNFAEEILWVFVVAQWRTRKIAEFTGKNCVLFLYCELTCETTKLQHAK